MMPAPAAATAAPSGVARSDIEKPGVDTASVVATTAPSTTTACGVKNSVDETSAADIELVLGFLEPSSTPFDRASFPSKAGGLPVFLHTLPASTPTCQLCGEPMRFLVQLYAPTDTSHGEAFHRSLYLYVCAEAGCARPSGAKCVRALRAQLPRRNTLYPYNAGDPPPAMAAEMATTQGACAVCGGLAKTRCSATREWYCGQKCQRRDWRMGNKEVCKARKEGREEDTRVAEETLREKRRMERFPEFGLETEAWSEGEESASGSDSDSEDEDAVSGSGSDDGEVAGRDGDANDPDDPTSVDAESRQTEADSAKASGRTQPVPSDSDSEQPAPAEKPTADPALAGAAGTMQDASAEELPEELFAPRRARDLAFERFSRATRDPPDQVLRYARGGECVWPYAAGRLGADERRCVQCGGRLVFEFEVLPQMLCFLEQGTDADKRSSIEEIVGRLKDGVDWGVIAVFTCEASCSVGEEYAEEVAWLQSAA